MSETINSLSEQQFRQHIKQPLFHLLEKRSGMTKEAINLYLTDENLKHFANAFTHPSFDDINNYEYYETLGDATLNKCMVWYFHRRFPELKKQQGANKIMTNLKTQNVSRDKFSDLSRRLEFQNYIRFKAIEDPKRKMINVIDKKMLTDVFESVMGCLEDIIDNTEKIPGIGATPIYNILSTLMDQDKSITLESAKVSEPKTQLLQLFETKRWPQILFKDRKIEEDQNGTKLSYYYVSVILEFPDPNTNNPVKITMPEQKSLKKKDAEKAVAKAALELLKTKYNIV
jgi:dsRNA-specific ribonuclease